MLCSDYSCSPAQTVTKFHRSILSTEPAFFKERQMGRGRKTKLVTVAHAISFMRRFPGNFSDSTREKFVTVLEDLRGGNTALIYEGSADDAHDMDSDSCSSSDSDSDEDDGDDEDDKEYTPTARRMAAKRTLTRTAAVGVSPRVRLVSRLSDMESVVVDSNPSASSSAAGKARAGLAVRPAPAPASFSGFSAPRVESGLAVRPAPAPASFSGFSAPRVESAGEPAAPEEPTMCSLSGRSEEEVPADMICCDSNANFFIDFKAVRRNPRFDTQLPVYYHEKFGYAIRTTWLVGMVYDATYDTAVEVCHSSLMQILRQFLPPLCFSGSSLIPHAISPAIPPLCFSGSNSHEPPCSQILACLSEDFYPDERYMQLPICKHGHHARFLSLRESAKLIEFIPDELEDHIRRHFSEVLYMEASKRRESSFTTFEGGPPRFCNRAIRARLEAANGEDYDRSFSPMVDAEPERVEPTYSPTAPSYVPTSPSYNPTSPSYTPQDPDARWYRRPRQLHFSSSSSSKPADTDAAADAKLDADADAMLNADADAGAAPVAPLAAPEPPVAPLDTADAAAPEPPVAPLAAPEPPVAPLDAATAIAPVPPVVPVEAQPDAAAAIAPEPPVVSVEAQLDATVPFVLDSAIATLEAQSGECDGEGAGGAPDSRKRLRESDTAMMEVETQRRRLENNADILRQYREICAATDIDEESRAIFKKDLMDILKASSSSSSSSA